MPRPCKCRRICARPACRCFGPLEEVPSLTSESITLALDEFETIRLIDLEGLSQEECATQMNVARTTVQSIYSSARAKLASCLVQSRALIIEGGHFEFCDGQPSGAGCGRRFQYCPRRQAKGEGKMRIAVPYENEQVFQHFGHTERFQVYDVEGSEVKVKTLVNTNGSGHGALADILKKLEVDTLICGGIGGGAQMALTEAGIKFYGGVTGKADQAVEDLLKGQLHFDPEAHCDHHDHQHGEGHHCGEQGCGRHHGE